MRYFTIDDNEYQSSDEDGNPVTLPRSIVSSSLSGTVKVQPNISVIAQPLINNILLSVLRTLAQVDATAGAGAQWSQFKRLYKSQYVADHNPRVDDKDLPDADAEEFEVYLMLSEERRRWDILRVPDGVGVFFGAGPELAVFNAHTLRRFAIALRTLEVDASAGQRRRAVVEEYERLGYVFTDIPDPEPDEGVID